MATSHQLSWRRKWQPTPVFLPAESHGQRSLVGYRLWGCKEVDTTEWLSTNVYMSVLLSLFIPLFSSLIIHKSILYTFIFILSLKIGSSILFFYILYICVNIPYLFFSF